MERHESEMTASLTPRTDELRRQWSADMDGLENIGANPPGWRAFQAALDLCAILEFEVGDLEAKLDQLQGYLP